MCLSFLPMLIELQSFISSITDMISWVDYPRIYLEYWTRQNPLLIDWFSISSIGTWILIDLPRHSSTMINSVINAFPICIFQLESGCHCNFNRRQVTLIIFSYKSITLFADTHEFRVRYGIVRFNDVIDKSHESVVTLDEFELNDFDHYWNSAISIE